MAQTKFKYILFDSGIRYSDLSEELLHGAELAHDFFSNIKKITATVALDNFSKIAFAIGADNFDTIPNFEPTFGLPNGAWFNSNGVPIKDTLLFGNYFPQLKTIAEAGVRDPISAFYTIRIKSDFELNKVHEFTVDGSTYDSTSWSNTLNNAYEHKNNDTLNPLTYFKYTFAKNSDESAFLFEEDANMPYFISLDQLPFINDTESNYGTYYINGLTSMLEEESISCDNFRVYILLISMMPEDATDSPMGTIKSLSFEI